LGSELIVSKNSERKLQICCVKYLDIGSLYTKIKVKNMVTFFYQTVDWMKLPKPSTTFPFFLQGCMTRECAIIILEEVLRNFDPNSKFYNPNLIGAHILLPITTMAQAISEHFKESWGYLASFSGGKPSKKASCIQNCIVHQIYPNHYQTWWFENFHLKRLIRHIKNNSKVTNQALSPLEPI
jgi:hypothetical protein